MGRPILPSPITATCTAPTAFRVIAAGLAPRVGAGAQRQLNLDRALVDPPAEDLECPQPRYDERVRHGDRPGILSAAGPQHGYAGTRASAGAADERARQEQRALGLELQQPGNVVPDVALDLRAGSRGQWRGQDQPVVPAEQPVQAACPASLIHE